MDKLEFLEAMKAEPKPLQYGKYSDINSVPVEIADEEVFSAWYDHVVKNCGAGPDTTLSQIPLPYVTDELRRKAISRSVRSLIYIKPEHTDAYRDLVILGLKVSLMAFMMMDDSLKTTDFLAEVAAKVPGALDLNWGAQEWIAGVMTPEIRDSVLSTNLKFALSLPEADVSWEQWTHLFKTEPYAAEIVERSSRPELFLRFLHDGNWPNDWQGTTLTRTDDVNVLADLVTQTEDTDEAEHFIYRAKIKTFPIEEVIKVMNTPDRLRFLMSFAPEETLRKHMKLNRALRGKLLEHDLGM